MIYAPLPYVPVDLTALPSVLFDAPTLRVLGLDVEIDTYRWFADQGIDVDERLIVSLEVVGEGIVIVTENPADEHGDPILHPTGDGFVEVTFELHPDRPPPCLDAHLRSLV